VLSAKDAGLHNNATFNVADGPGAVDMDVTGNLVNNFANGSFTKTGAGTVRFSGNNTYSGATNISGGTMLLGANNTLPDGAAFNLSGGTILKSGGFSDATGPLGLSGPAAIDLGSGGLENSTLTFSNISTWSGLLSIWNYTGGAIWTGSTGDKLIFSAQTGSFDLANVQFYSGNIGDTGSAIGVGAGFVGNELVPVPEPTAVVSLLLLLGVAGYRERRFSSRKAESK
jgi:autotransporter-associated beta strand protein